MQTRNLGKEEKGRDRNKRKRKKQKEKGAHKMETGVNKGGLTISYPSRVLTFKCSDLVGHFVIFMSWAKHTAIQVIYSSANAVMC